MPESPDEYEPTEADIEMVIEETTGKPVKPASAASGITSMRARITQLEAEKATVLDRLDTATGKLEKDLNADLSTLNNNLVVARERLAHYKAQLDKQN